MRIAMLTGGGDCPGLNAVIIAVTRRAVTSYGWEVLGIRNGWAGLVNGEVEPLGLSSVSGILHEGGTILGTTRTNPFKSDEGVESVLRNVRRHSIDAVVAIGGEDTLGVASRLHSDHGLHVVGVPKTIDNDLSGTDYTFGFDTAVHVATQAVDRLHSTAESHNRVMVVEVMGRHTGWIAVMAGIAGGADAIVIPEFPLTVEEVCALIRRRSERGKRYSIVVVSEGAPLLVGDSAGQTIVSSDEVDAFGHVRLGGVGTELAKEIERITGIEARVTILGYVQRGGSPTARDRMLATAYGVKAAEMAQAGEWGMMAALRGTKVIAVPLSEALASLKCVPRDLYEIAQTFFG
jgi:phosphofructokinase-like protein